MTDEKGTYTHIHTDHGSWYKEYYNPDDLTDVNRVRNMDNKGSITSLHGYCMSTGCSCIDHNGAKGNPICGLFKGYEADGIKRDFINQIFGI